MGFFSRSSLDRCYSIAGLQKLAIKKLPRMVSDFLEGGAEDEKTLRSNSSSFDRFDLVPRVLKDISNIDISTTIMGQKIDTPVMLAPTGMSRMFHQQGEMAVSKAASEANTIYNLSSMSTYNIEEVAQGSTGPKWFQIYVWKDQGIVKEFIDRCKESGYHGLCLTVDVAALGQRERDLRNGMTLPPRFTLSALFDTALHPGWWSRHMINPKLQLANVAGKQGKGLENVTSQTRFAQSMMDNTVTWDDAQRMIEQWGGPFAIKGISSPADAVRAVEVGAKGIILGNHGGRQLDGCVSPFNILEDVVQAVGNSAEIYLDGGVRRGSDVVKALCLGARACTIGRAYLYGLAAGGQAGVSKALSLLNGEITRTMQLMGCSSVKELNKNFLKEKK